MDVADADGVDLHFVTVNMPPAYRGPSFKADRAALHAGRGRELDRLVLSYREERTSGYAATTHATEVIEPSLLLIKPVGRDDLVRAVADAPAREV